MSFDYSEYTLSELYEARDAVDRDKQPERFAKICEEIELKREPDEAKTTKQKWIAGFWKRSIAFFVDALLLNLIGFVLGSVFGNTFSQIGQWSHLIGFIVALLYFGIMDSALSQGQTLGKKLLKLRVVNSENQFITLKKSVLRSLILIVPFFLNSAQLPYELTLSFLIYPISFITIGGLLALAYLYLFNRQTQQSLHDLIIGTYVINAKIEKQKPNPIWKIHSIVASMLIIAAGTSPVFFEKFIQENEFQSMLSIHNAFLNESDVVNAGAFVGASTFQPSNGESQSITYVNTNAILSSKNINDDNLARHLATIVLQNYSTAYSKDVLRVTLSHGYDIGIWSHWSRRTYEFKPSELVDLQ